MWHKYLKLKKTWRTSWPSGRKKHGQPANSLAVSASRRHNPGQLDGVDCWSPHEKFEPSLQLKSRTTPGNQESFATRTKSSPRAPTPEEHAEYLHALRQDEIVEIDTGRKSPKPHCNSEQNVINLPAIVGCLSWIALRTRPDIAWAASNKFDYTWSGHLFHSCQAPLSISTLHLGICISICYYTSGDQAQAMGHERCLLCTNRGEESTRTNWKSWITSENKNGGNLVEWWSSRQDLIGKSTCEAELIASSEALQQGKNIAIVTVVVAQMSRSCEIEVSSDNAASLYDLAWFRNGLENKARQCEGTVDA